MVWYFVKHRDNFTWRPLAKTVGTLIMDVGFPLFLSHCALKPISGCCLCHQLKTRERAKNVLRCNMQISFID